MYKSNWEKQREKGFELRLDSLSILTAKAKRDLASDVSYSKKQSASLGLAWGEKLYFFRPTLHIWQKEKAIS